MLSHYEKAQYCLEVSQQVGVDMNQEYNLTVDDYASFSASELNQQFKLDKEFVSYCYSRKSHPNLFRYHSF